MRLFRSRIIVRLHLRRPGTAHRIFAYKVSALVFPSNVDFQFATHPGIDVRRRGMLRRFRVVVLVAPHIPDFAHMRRFFATPRLVSQGLDVRQMSIQTTMHRSA